MPDATVEYVDVAAVLDGTFNAPETAVGGRRSDGLPLLYPSAVNVLLGAPEAGKTLVAGAMVADELFSGGTALWIDLDHNGPHAILTRLRALGVSRDVLINPAVFRLAVPNDADEVMRVVMDASSWSPTVSVVDSIGELMPMFGGNSNDADDYTRVHRTVLTALANKGAGVLGIDHEAKGSESRSYGATGSAAKKRAVDGALLRVTNVRQFSPSTGGEAMLTIVKDRHGALRRVTGPDREPPIAGFSLAPRGDAMLARFAVPSGASVAATGDVEALLGMIPAPRSVKDVMARNGWGTNRASAALRQFRAVPRNVQEYPRNAVDSSVPPFLSPLGEERGTIPGTEVA